MTLSGDFRPNDKLDVADDELEIVDACETGQLKSVATKSELAKFEAAARDTVMRDRRDRLGFASD